MAGAEVITGQEGVQGLKNDRRVRMQVNEQAGRKWQESVWSLENRMTGSSPGKGNNCGFSVKLRCKWDISSKPTPH